MSLLESYTLKEDGFQPLLIMDSWQVAKLSYSEEYSFPKLTHLSRHQKTDRAFALLTGNAMLIAMNLNGETQLQTQQMQRGTSYNIPQNMAYAIVMEENSEVFIVEKSNTHVNDVELMPLTAEQRNAIRLSMNQEKEQNHG